MSQFIRPYGVAFNVRIPIVKAGSSDFAASADWTPAAGDVKLSKDGGTVANITTLPTAVAGTGSVLWDFSFSATEAQAAEITVQIVDAAVKAVQDQAFSVITDLASKMGGADGATVEFGIIDRGIAQAAAATSLTLRAGFSATDGVVVGATLWIYSSTNGLHERRIITAWNNTTKVATVDAWTQIPTGTIRYAMFATPPSSAGAPVTANVTQWNGSAVAAPNVAGVPKVDLTHWLGTAAAAPNVAGTPKVDVTLVSGVAEPLTSDLNDIQARLPAALIGGRMDSSLRDLVGDTTAATRLANFAYIVARQNTAQAGGPSTITLDTGASAISQNYRHLLIAITSGTGVNQARWVTDYDGTTKIATVDRPWTTQPIVGSQFTLFNISRAFVDAEALATNAVDADALATDAANEIRDAIFARTMGSGYNNATFEQMLQIIAAATAGKASGLATTAAVYRNWADLVDAIAATVDADGNRSLVTRTYG